MAYKFQLGAAILSGSIKAEDGIVSTDVDATTADNVIARLDNGDIPIVKLAEKQISGKDLGTNLDSLSVDDSSIEFSAGSAFNGSANSSIRVKALGITNAMLAGSVASSKIAELSAFDTGDLAEGSNLYYTSARWDAKMAAADTGDLAEGSNLYYTSARWDAKMAAADTGDLSEGSNLYYTDARVTTRVADAASATAVRGHLAVGDSNSIDMSYVLGTFSADIKKKASEFDITVANGLELAALGIVNSKLANSSLSVVAGSGLSGGGSIDLGSSVTLDIEVSGAVKIASDKVGLSGSIAGDALDYFGGVDSISALHVVADESSIEAVGRNSLRVKALGITNDMLAGSVASSKIAELNSFDTGDLAEGSNLYYTTARWDSKMAAADTGDLAEGSNLYYTDARSRASVSRVDAGGDGSFDYNSSTGVFTYTGPSAAEARAHFSVADTNSVDMSYASGQFSADVSLASANALEIGVSGLDLKSSIAGNRTFTNDLTIGGDLTVNGTTTSINTTTLEVEDKNIMMAKGNADLAGADGAGFTIEAGSDDITFQWANASTQMELKSGASFINLKANKFIGDIEGSVSQEIGQMADADGTLVVGFNYGSADTTALRTWTLPASPEVGHIVHVKAPSAVNAAGIEILRAGTQLIDGEEFIILESPYAAVSLMYVTTDVWRVF